MGTIDVQVRHVRTQPFPVVIVQWMTEAVEDIGSEAGTVIDNESATLRGVPCP